MPLYFAYGANLDVSAMAARCPKSRPLGLGRLARYRFAIQETGFATVVPDARAQVHGLLYDLAMADVPALDRYEEVGRGLYRKVVQPVLRAPVGSARALVYLGTAAREGAPAPGYVENIVASAQALGLPAAYIAFLESLAPSAQQRMSRR
ncbi:gamma-glutamylcyclotransferase [Methylosinus sp. H3A]|uniref:gamma-glutamylcyclotransferase family protein n=1 Tax=Methylosinus sp. H3A TaxID=2785786 RepID=UPI0018C327EF|nr:gamma-glutamylcyclotransferase family protein [Methylosinus sp. H3A]MBG0808745.1 gamma-glutamylcyclotransferase [Methylosinus sp. H3A]